jgi:pimeloyl-ACP methyl ester carboxylesterase
MMSGKSRSFVRGALLIGSAALTLALTSAPAGAALKVTWMKSFAAPGTPVKYDQVGVLKVGRKTAKNVLVLEPGTSAGSAYFVPLAQWITKTLPNWQVWSIERRENLLEDQSVFNLDKQHKVTAQQVFDYYLGFLDNMMIAKHLTLIPDATVGYARQWGMNVAVQDIHNVIAAAHKLGGHVVLGGHSLGGTVVTAYATWDFHGKAGADGLSGLVYDDGASGTTPPTAAQATASLQTLATSTPWLAFSGIPAPFLGLFSTLGSTAALYDPNGPSIGQASPLLPATLKPPIPVTELAQFGYAIDTKTSTLSFASQAHVGQLDTSTTPAGWSNAGAITPLVRYAAMLAGNGVQGTDGTEWYFPQRLTIDSGAIDEGNDNPAQAVYGDHATHGADLPKSLLMYAFGAAGGQSILSSTTTLAGQSHIPSSNLTLVNRQGAYAHNDPAAAYPKNDFFNNLIPFLRKAAKVHP